MLRQYVKALAGEELTLNLLWWEWPESSHAALRDGWSTNFMQHPDPDIVSNPPMDPVQLQMAISF